MSGGSWLDGAGEASERALFARRARALPAAPVPSLDAILAAADGNAPARGDGARPARRAWQRGRAGATAAFALVAAACVAGVILVSARTAGQRRLSIVASDNDAAAPTPAGSLRDPRSRSAWAASAGPMCEPAGEEDDRGASCVLQASFVLASSDQASHACSQPEKPAQTASFSSYVSNTRMSVGALACERGPEMSYR